MLAGKGFSRVINVSGGIKAWDSNTAIGPEDSGLELLSGKEPLEEVLVVAYSMEQGLRDFYLSMADRVETPGVRELFEKLSEIEIRHQEKIFAEYAAVAADPRSREDFERELVKPAVEGGLTTEEYLERYQPDLDQVTEVVSLAMAIEAQALDLYQRSADRADQEETRTALLRIADEERTHLQLLAELLDGEEVRV